MKDPRRIVSFTFRLLEKVSADLKLRLRYDNLSQSKFMSGITELYLQKDPDMLCVIEKIKQRKKIMGKQKLKRTKQDIDKGNKLLEELGITDSDKQNIFDMIEMNMEEYE